MSSSSAVFSRRSIRHSFANLIVPRHQRPLARLPHLHDLRLRAGNPPRTRGCGWGFAAGERSIIFQGSCVQGRIFVLEISAGLFGQDLSESETYVVDLCVLGVVWDLR